MPQSTTITQKWQMTLPKDIREHLNLKKPGSFWLEVIDRKEKLLKIRKKPGFLALAGSLPVKNKKGRILNAVKIRDYIETNYYRK